MPRRRSALVDGLRDAGVLPVALAYGTRDDRSAGAASSACRCWPSSAHVRTRRRRAARAPSRTHRPRKAAATEAPAAKPEAARPPAASTSSPAWCTTTPVRSGQQVYAREPRPDRLRHRRRRRRGHRRRLDPHLRRPARPRPRRRAAAMTSARIFCREFHAELVAIAGALQGAGGHTQGTARQGRADLAGGRAAAHRSRWH